METDMFVMPLGYVKVIM